MIEVCFERIALLATVLRGKELVGSYSERWWSQPRWWQQRGVNRSDSRSVLKAEPTGLPHGLNGM